MTPATLNLLARAPRRRCHLPFLALVLTAFSLGACSIDPDDWIRSADKPVAKAKAGPDSDRPFPNLASVPEAPDPIDAEERKRVAESLIADRNDARYTGEMIRLQTEELAPPPDGVADAREAGGEATRESAAETDTAMAKAGELAAVPAPAGNGLSQARRPAPPVRAENDRPPRPSGVAAQPPPPADLLDPIEQRPPQGAHDRVASNAQQRLFRLAPAGDRPESRFNGSRLRFGPPPDDIAIVQRARAQRAAPAPVNGAALNRRAAPRLQRPSAAFAAPRRFDAPGMAGERAATIGFRSGSSAVSAAGRQALDKIAAAHQRRGGEVRVVGHSSSRTCTTDPTRRALVNFQISLDRANAAARILMSMGVPARSIAISALSDARPRYSETTPSGEAANRRVEVFLDGPG